MFKPSGVRDTIGAVLLVLVGLLYLTGITDTQPEHAAESEDPAAVVTVSGLSDCGASFLITT